MLEATGSDNMVVGVAKWSVKGKNAEGVVTMFLGSVTHVFEKQADGSLKLKLHIFI